MRRHVQYLQVALLVLSGGWSLPAWSQPDWSVVPEEYEFTMTVTGFARINCQVSNDPLNMVAAFINNEVRGVQYFSDEVNGQQLAFMIVYDNMFSGNAVTFKVYDAGMDSIYEVFGDVEFRESGSHGNSDNPYQFNTSSGIADVLVAEDVISPELQANEIATTIITLDENGSAIPAELIFIDDPLGGDNHYFILEGNDLLLNVDASTIADDVVELHILATPDDGCALASPLQLTISEVTATGADFANPDLHIYPNPSQGAVHWHSATPFEQVGVYSLDGRILLQTEVQDADHLDLSVLGSGVYVLRFRGKDGAQTGRVMIE